MKRFFSFVLGAVIGAVAGATIALLITPYSGEQLRAQAREAALAKRAQLEARLRDLRTTGGAAAPEKPA
ncbi:MAG: YtxH domain-containing protein [Chloroflexi bacterium]|nr:YtxH domain-containing protein [Chloroflexota bacterium]